SDLTGHTRIAAGTAGRRARAAFSAGTGRPVAHPPAGPAPRGGQLHAIEQDAGVAARVARCAHAPGASLADHDLQAVGEVLGGPEVAGDAPGSAAAAPVAVAARAAGAGAAAAPAAAELRLDEPRPRRRLPRRVGVEDGRFAAHRAQREGDAAVGAVDPQRLAPLAAVVADLEHQVVVAHQTELRPAVPAGLEQQRQDVAGALLVQHQPK